jgi:hypothetical protein
MKNIIIIIICLATGITTYAQQAKRDSLIRAIDMHTANTYKAAAQFLNKRLSAAERIKAITPYSAILDPKQIEQFKAVVLSNEESPEIRATALDKIDNDASSDAQIVKLATDWVGNTQAPMILRRGGLNLVTVSTFSTMRVPEVLQKLLDDPDLDFRIYAYTQLVQHGNDMAQQRLIRGLENQQSANIPAPVAIGILNMSPKKEYYPAVYKVLQSTKDEATRLEAIRALGPYKEAREQLKSISMSASEKPEFREAALGALYSGDKDNIITYTMPILKDKNASPRLQAIAIQMSIDVRQSMSYRSKASKADDYDKLIKDIAEGKGALRSAELEKTANRYMQIVRPKY